MDIHVDCHFVFNSDEKSLNGQNNKMQTTMAITMMTHFFFIMSMYLGVSVFCQTVKYGMSLLLFVQLFITMHKKYYFINLTCFF